jgi:hypothetical protein
MSIEPVIKNQEERKSVNRKLWIAFLVSFFLVQVATCNHAYGQSKKDSLVKSDTSITTQTPIITVGDLEEINDILKKKFTIAQANDYNEVFALIQRIVATRSREWEEKNKKKKP